MHVLPVATALPRTWRLSRSLCAGTGGSGWVRSVGRLLGPGRRMVPLAATAVVVAVGGIEGRVRCWVVRTGGRVW